MPVERNWKKAFDEDFDENGHDRTPGKTGLTMGQKHWLVRAWTHIFGEVPNAMPGESNEGLSVRKSTTKTNWHHVRPQGLSVRVDGRMPDYPENIVPIDEYNHTGRGYRGDVSNTDEIIHEDDVWAHRNYTGTRRPTSYDKVNAERRRRTTAGQEYHNNIWDGFFSALAQMVTRRYKAEHPEDPWPEKKKRK